MTDSSFRQPSLFKWTALSIATLFGIVLLWMITDFKQRILVSMEKAEATLDNAKRSVDNVNSKLPAILVEVKQTSQTLARVADDVELMKRVAGIDHESQDRGVRGFALYADELQQILNEQAVAHPAKILKEEVVGSDLKVVETLEEFLVGLSKEMIVAILPVSKSRQEILYRVCHSGVRRVPFYIQIEDAEPVLLEEFVKEHHAASRELPEFFSE